MRTTLVCDYGLSKREAEVAELISQGLSNKEAANQLFVTEKTVKFHLTNIYKRMELKTRSQLIVKLLGLPGALPAGHKHEPAPEAHETPAPATMCSGLPSGNNQAA